MQLGTRAATLFAIVALVACRSKRDASLAEYTLRHGMVRFEAPVAWHLLQQQDSAANSSIVFHIRNPVTDSGPDRANVLVRALSRPSGQELRLLTDTLFGEVLDPGALVLGDTMPGPDRRFFFWRGQQRGTPYVIYDDFARRDSIIIHVRMTVPVVSGTPAEWNETYSRDTERVLSSVTVDRRQVFPDWAGHPQLAAFGPPSS